MDFRPPSCPRSDCPSHQGQPFLYQRSGSYQRHCDGRIVQRYFCRSCRRRFSRQSFRLDYRLKLPLLHLAVFDDLVAKVTLRQMGRKRRVDRKTIAKRLRLLGEHAREFHQRMLERRAGALTGCFQLDELETFEGARRLKPVTVPVLIERSSYFVIAADVAPLPARGKLSKRGRERKRLLEEREGRRRSGSREAVERCLEILERAVGRGRELSIQTDGKHTYRSLLRRSFSERLQHQVCDAKAPRTYDNPLFPINHTLAMLRDGLSRLVRRNWGASKKRGWLLRHLWVWILYRNYVREITVKAPKVSAAMVAGICRRRFASIEVLRWKARYPELAHLH